MAVPLRPDDGPLAELAEQVVAGTAAPGATPPAALIAVTSDDNVDYAARGRAIDLPDRRCAITWPTWSDLGSVTKIVATTAALMTLVDAGEVALHTPVGSVLPSAAAANSTVADLLMHRAGLWEWWPLYATGLRGGEALELAATLPLRYPPGQARHYSDLGFVLLGELVSRVCGADLATAVTELVLGPFGLAELAFGAPPVDAPTAASSYGDAIERDMIATGRPYPVPVDGDSFSGWRRHVLIGEVNDGNSFHAFGGVAGHAGMFGTASGLLRFAEQLRASLDGDGPIGRATTKAFATPGPDPGQAAGLRVWRSGAQRALGHTGFPGVAFAVLPELHASAVLITNRLHARGTPPSTEDLWLHSLRAVEKYLTGNSGPWT
jgi:CubicO group peptidase (beta-lactamase class C family)